MKYNIGEEFVIRIGEEFRTSGVVGTGNEAVKSPDRLYRMEGFNSLVFDENGLDKLDQLTDDYINEHYGMFQDAAYQKGLEDAWKIAQKLALNESDGGMLTEKVRDIFGFQSIYDIFKSHTASEAIEKIREYEEKQKVKDEIKAGDEIKDFSNPYHTLVVVTAKNGYYSGISNNGYAELYVPVDKKPIKTGRHFPQIAEVLEQMKKGEKV